MSKKNWSFTKKNTYGPVPSKEGFKLPEYPPFTTAELNSSDMGHLGQIVRDDFGRVYMNVRYAQLTTAGAAGLLVAFPNATQVTTHGTTACTTAATTVTLNVAFLNAFKNWFLAGGYGISAGASTIAGFLRRIYSDSGGTNTHTFVASEYKKEELIRSHYDGNRILNAAGAEDGYTTSIATNSILRPSYDVVLADSNAADIKSQPVGVLLGAVTAASGAYETSDAAGTLCTYKSTWIQVFGPGLVKSTGNSTINVTLFYAGTTPANGALLSTLGATSLIQAQSIGLATATDGAGNGHLIPTFINPAGYHFFNS